MKVQLKKVTVRWDTKVRGLTALASSRHSPSRCKRFHPPYWATCSSHKGVSWYVDTPPITNLAEVQRTLSTEETYLRTHSLLLCKLSVSAAAHDTTI